MDSATSQAMGRRLTTCVIIAGFWLALPGRDSVGAQAPGFGGAVDKIIDGTVANNRLPSIGVVIGRRGKMILYPLRRPDESRQEMIATALYGRPIVMHSGRIPGFNAITSTFTDTGWSIVAMTNIDVSNYAIDNASRAILDAVCGPSSKFKHQCF